MSLRVWAHLMRLTPALLLTLAGCAPHLINPVVSNPGGASVFAQLPLRSGWFEGEAVHYLTTDASDAETARKLNANFAPGLAAALRDPTARGLVARIYKFTNVDQGTVLPSAPTPLGFENRDRGYSPLWVLIEVTWADPRQARLLTSEEEVLAAQDKLEVVLEDTGIVVNCPVVVSARGALPDTRAVGELPGKAGKR